ncbi:MAG: cupredoxin domain-containing protein [Solirubrobacterales bacterium]
MNPEIFYYIGGALTLCAVVFSAIGLRNKGFPASRGAMFGTLALFVFLVVGSATYAVVNARDEQQHRRAELAESGEGAVDAEEAGQEALDAAETGGTGSDAASASDEAEAGAADEAAADDGTVAMSEYAFGPPDVTIAGGDTVTAQNDGEIIHNLTVFDGEDELAGTENVEPGAASDLEIKLDPGDYQMICTIPGHEDLGMSGGFNVE